MDNPETLEVGAEAKVATPTPAQKVEVKIEPEVVIPEHLDVNGNVVPPQTPEVDSEFVAG